ncbi:hypothetical protein [Streptomyces sp. JW3]|uniref:hypothetical protein n=1 Tax=Streptomyces sp. JW3 TaxID=3456955 RepID=UPI003FA47672
MDEHGHDHDRGPHDDLLRAAFQAVLDAGPEPALPSVTDAAVTGGRRIRRRRAVAGTASALAVCAVTVTVAVGLSGTDGGPAQRPLAPAGTGRPTPGPLTPTPAPPVASTAATGPSAAETATDPWLPVPAASNAGEAAEAGRTAGPD